MSEKPRPVDPTVEAQMRALEAARGSTPTGAPVPVEVVFRALKPPPHRPR